MARNSIKFLLKKELQAKESYGRSKHEDKLHTQMERNKLKQQGVPYLERMRIDYCKDHIYSYNTMKQYQKSVGYFGDYLISIGKKKISIAESKDYIEEYIDYLENEKHLSATSIHLYLAAICKATGASLYDYHHPARSIADIKRGIKDVDMDTITNPEVKRVLQANRLLGLRQSELKHLRACDIIEKDNLVIVNSIGKGKKHNQQIFFHEDEKEAVLSLLDGKKDLEYLFSREACTSNVNYHKMRELRAKDVYASVCKDIEENGTEAETKYQKIIHQIFEENGKCLHEDLNTPIFLRGKNRLLHQQAGKPIAYNRTAVMFVSVTVTNHFRTDTTLSHYIGK